MVPVPVPAVLTVRSNVDFSKVAVTDSLEFMVTLQEPVPEQAPLQPVNVEPVAGTAVSSTTVPFGNVVPVGNDAMVPLPDPATLRLRVSCPDCDMTNVVESNDPPAGAFGSLTIIGPVPLLGSKKVFWPGVYVAIPELSRIPLSGGE
jgi:hypothetical protein